MWKYVRGLSLSTTNITNDRRFPERIAALSEVTYMAPKYLDRILYDLKLAAKHAVSSVPINKKEAIVEQ